jgi:excisionase family DNA binding protein
MSIEDLPILLTVDEVAKIMRVGRSNVYEMARRKEIPVYRVSEGRIRIPRDEFFAWLEKRRVGDGVY